MTAPTTTARIVLASAAILLGALVLWFTPDAGAQDDVDCERVTYNQRIVIVCDTADSGSAGDTGTARPTPTAAPNTTPTPDDDDAEDPEDTDDAADVAGGDRIDRGSRGERVLADDDIFDFDFDADDGDDGDAADGDAAEGDADDGDQRGARDETAPTESDADDSDAEESVSGETTGTGEFVGVVDPAPSDLPLVVGVAGLLGLGAVFLIAARRTDVADDR